MDERQQRLVLGVDGGGTTTTAVVCDERGRILGMKTTGPGNYRSVGLRMSMKNIVLAAGGALQQSHVSYARIAASCFGISATDSLVERKRIHTALVHAFPRTLSRRPFVVVNDILTGFRSGTEAPYGAAVIAGTGSNAFARGRDGRDVTAGGLGPLLADNGGGYDIGHAVLRAAAKSADGRIPASLLERMVCRKLKVKTIRDATTKVYGPDGGPHMVASFAPLASRAAARGDTAARRILHDAATELALLAATVLHRARLSSISCDLVLIGGVFDETVVLLPSFVHLVRRTAPMVRFVRPRRPYAVGAARLALAELHNKRQRSARRRR